jgi:DNA-binding NarL/FixJ family response regulator
VVVFVIDEHIIYRSGVVACLAGLDDVDTVIAVGSVSEARSDERLSEADVVLVDDELPGTYELIRHIGDNCSARVVVFSSQPDEHRVIAAVQAGAIGYLRKESLTAESLASGMRAAADNSGVMTPELLGTLLRTLSRVSRDMLEPRGISLTRLTEREQAVLRLVAAGHATREVAAEMCYSERTIKNVLHDISTKLDARTRSQAVAAAVREGLI